MDKIFIQFPQQWWEAGCDGFSFLYNLQETPETITKEVLYCSFSKFQSIDNCTVDSRLNNCVASYNYTSEIEKKSMHSNR